MAAMNPSNGRILLIAGLLVILLLFMVLLLVWAIWGWPSSFVVKGFSWS
jgi:hypothetical protein